MVGSTTRGGDDWTDAREFPHPPATFLDDAGRTIEIRTSDERDSAGLVEMYDSLDDGDRAQGLPPRSRRRIREWLEDLLDTGHNLACWHGGRAVGHACLLPGGERGHELAIFVASDYQHAGIGTKLLRTLLGHGRERGVDRVWLVVRRDNVVARRLYESAGFERVDGPTGGLAADVEMERPL